MLALICFCIFWKWRYAGIVIEELQNWLFAIKIICFQRKEASWVRAGFGKRFLVFNASEFEEISDLKFGVSADSFADNISSGFEWNTCVYKTTEGEFLRFLIQSLVIINN